MEQQQNVLSNTKLIRKRDKRLKEYDISHIRNAVWAAYKELGLEKEFQEQIGHIVVHVNSRVMSNEEKIIDINEMKIVDDDVIDTKILILPLYLCIYTVIFYYLYKYYLYKFFNDDSSHNPKSI